MHVKFRSDYVATSIGNWQNVINLLKDSVFPLTDLSSLQTSRDNEVRTV